MKKHVNLTLICAIVYGFLALILPRASADLIEPTRTLDAANQSGRVSVYSEPPDLPVKLDGNHIGFTPVIDYSIEPGDHELIVNDINSEINIRPGQSLKLSLYKDTLIEIPETKEEVTQRRKPEKAPARDVKKASTDPGGKSQLQPLYWPLNPKGPIY